MKAVDVRETIEDAKSFAAIRNAKAKVDKYYRRADDILRRKRNLRRAN